MVSPVIAVKTGAPRLCFTRGSYKGNRHVVAPARRNEIESACEGP